MKKLLLSFIIIGSVSAQAGVAIGNQFSPKKNSQLAYKKHKECHEKDEDRQDEKSEYRHERMRHEFRGKI